MAIIGIAVFMGGVMLYFNERQLDAHAPKTIRSILAMTGGTTVLFTFISVHLYRKIQARKRGRPEFFEVIR
jgi:hypothetical protein